MANAHFTDIFHLYQYDSKGPGSEQIYMYKMSLVCHLTELIWGGDLWNAHKMEHSFFSKPNGFLFL